MIKPEQEVFDSQVFQSAENILECQARMKRLKEDRGEFGLSRSPGKDGILQRIFQNRSPISKGREKWVPTLDMNIGRSSPISIKVE